MPWYDLDCSTCGHLEDEHREVDQREVCPKCDGPCTVVIAPVRTVGIVWSNVEYNSQIGKTFENNAQKREWLKKNPKVYEFEKGSSDDRKFSDRLAETVHDKVTKAGFKDHEEFKSHLQMRKAEEANAKS